MSRWIVTSKLRRIMSQFRFFVIYHAFKPTGTIESFVADLGWQPENFEVIWAKYGNTLRSIHVEKLDVMWVASWMKKNLPKASLAAEWRTTRGTFTRRAIWTRQRLVLVLNEVRFESYQITEYLLRSCLTELLWRFLGQVGCLLGMRATMKCSRM